MKIYNTHEVCEMLSVSRKTLQKYIATGELKAIRLGNQIRITEEALENFFELKAIKVKEKPIDILKNK